MIRITNVYNRPTVDVPFHSVNMTPELFDHVRTTYKDTDKLISIDVSKSDDLLTMTAVWVWSSPAARAEYQADPIVQQWINTITSHNETYGIINVSKLVETI